MASLGTNSIHYSSCADPGILNIRVLESVNSLNLMKISLLIFRDLTSTDLIETTLLLPTNVGRGAICVKIICTF